MHIDRITIAITHMAEMVKFYDAVFNAGLEPLGPETSVQFQRGTLDGKVLLFCPNTIAEVDAQQNRQQFRFVVDDLDTVIQRALENGGRQRGGVQQDGQAKLGAVADPDGNTIEFIEYSA